MSPVEHNEPTLDNGKELLRESFYEPKNKRDRVKQGSRSQKRKRVKRSK